MISKPMRTILHALSYSDMELEASRRLVDLKKLDPVRIFCKKLDAEVYNGDYKVPLRLYFPSEEAMEKAAGTFHVVHSGNSREDSEGIFRVRASASSYGKRNAAERPGISLRKAFSEGRRFGEVRAESSAHEKNAEDFEGTECIDVGKSEALPEPVLLFFHGGGWVTESVETYDRVCAQMAISTGCMVISVEYRLAPEHHFPVGLLDCYAAARALYLGEFLENVDPKQITVIGDSAGGNLTAALSMMARDKGEFAVERQILIYPALNNCYTQESAFASVQENGEGYLLTAKKMERYLDLYEDTPADRQNPYFAPILATDLSNLPRTLILTAEYDPLRDEGEAYGEQLREAGNQVEMHRISDALHGFFALGIKFLHVQESFSYITQFLES